MNGDAPRYGVACGFQCPPGPGYWPIDAPEHPSAMGWRNPTHAFVAGLAVAPTAHAVVPATAPGEAQLSSDPNGAAGAEQAGTVALAPGQRVRLLGIDAGAPDATGTGADATRLWYRIAAPGGGEGWVQAVVPFAGDTGSDGRPSSLRPILLPATAAT